MTARKFGTSRTECEERRCGKRCVPNRLAWLAFGSGLKRNGGVSSAPRRQESHFRQKREEISLSFNVKKGQSLSRWDKMEIPAKFPEADLEGGELPAC